MKHLYIFLIFILAFLIISACSDSGTKPTPPVIEQHDTITVSIEQQTHRSISLRLNHKLQNPKDKYVLNSIAESDTSSFVILNSSFNDSVFIDDNDGAGLTIDTEYGYFAYRIDSTGVARDTSNIVTANTLPPTSHDFTWTEYTLGQFPPSNVLYDVWGASPENVYAVGGVRFGDSTFGVIKWDGSAWKSELLRGGKQAIFGFSENDIWVTGGTVWHYDGMVWERIDGYSQNNQSFPLDQVLYDNTPYSAIWGTSSDNLYFSSQRGKIVHWDGTMAQIAHDSGNNLLQDIYGYDKNSIWVVGYDENFDDYTVYFDGKFWIEYSNLPYFRTNPATVFSINPKENYIAGNSLLFGETGILTILNYPANIYIDKIRGHSNDLFACGSFGMVIHFNGVDWQRIDPTDSGRYYGICFLNHTVFIVGEDNGQAKIFIGEK